MEYENKNTSPSEHILVCLSSSPSNSKIIKTAAKMAHAFSGSFTALYVKTSDSDKMSEEDKKRLQSNINLAKQLGADITTLYGDEISYQIAEFARISGVTEIFIGRSTVRRKHFWNKPTLTEKLIETAPNLDIHIIPDTVSDKKYISPGKSLRKFFVTSINDILITAAILIFVTVTGSLFYELGFTEANIITIYLLGALLTSLFTKSYICSVISSLLSVLLFNFFFTEPRLTLHAYESGYPVTFAIMLTASLMTGTLANRLKKHAKLNSQAAYRTKILFDTNLMLQKAENESDIINITAGQLMKLLNRDIVIYPENNGCLSKGYLFTVSEEYDKRMFFNSKEEQAAQWVLENKHRAGASTKIFSDARCMYLAVRINKTVYAVVGIHINGKNPDSFENSVLLSILGECAMAINNIRIAREKELTAVKVKNEQLRANLLRSISHDLRTPLTSISGNAGNLIHNYDKLDDETKMRTFSDIFDESQWLISLVENLLSVTRLEEGRMQLHMSVHCMDEVIEEALRHISRKGESHIITVEPCKELLLANMDAKLIMQVIINLVDNAIKYTPAGSEIRIVSEKSEGFVSVSICDKGQGIPDSIKPRIFEMFYTGEHKTADARRSLGLGLHLCKAIINTHNGALTLTDNTPSGCIFTFRIPSGEVQINEQISDTCG